MSPEVTLGAVVIIPAVLLMLLRINAALVFLSLCLGDVLVQFASPDAGSFVEVFSANANIPSEHLNVKLFLLLLPALLTAVFMIRTVHGNGRLLLNLLPAIGVGLLGGLLVSPLLPPGLSHNIIDSQLWSSVQDVKGLIVGASALVCLLVLWLQRPSHKTGHKKHHGKH